MKAFDVAVIGLGAMGSAAAYELARRGRKVIALERFALGHANGSSHGESRAIRLTYFEGDGYVPLLHRAYSKWRDLEAYSNRNILTKTGMMSAGYPGSRLVGGAIETAEKQSLAHEVLSSADVERRFPRFRIPGDWTAMFDPEGGFVRPELAIRTFVEGALYAGAEIRFGAVVEGVDGASGTVKVKIGSETIEVGTAVVTTGPWIRELVPEVGARLSGLSQQVTGWFRPSRPELFAENRFPVFALEPEEGEYLYGFPDFAGTGVKAAFHDQTPDLPDLATRSSVADSLKCERLEHAIATYIPEASDSPRQPNFQTCIYTNTPDERFVIDRRPGHPNVIFASACSGHGFKFASVLGEVLATMAVSGATPTSIERFALSVGASAPEEASVI